MNVITPNMMSFEFPFLPPSVNACYRSYNRRVIKSVKLKSFQQQIIQFFDDLDETIPLLEGKLKVTIQYHLPNRRNVDIDNFCKSMLDSVEGILYENDREIYELNLTKFLNTGSAKTIFKIEKIREML